MDALYVGFLLGAGFAIGVGLIRIVNRATARLVERVGRALALRRNGWT